MVESASARYKGLIRTLIDWFAKSTAGAQLKGRSESGPGAASDSAANAAELEATRRERDALRAQLAAVGAELHAERQRAASRDAERDALLRSLERLLEHKLSLERGERPQA
jgi:hypothetical protein